MLQRYWVVVLLLIAFPLLPVVTVEDLASTAYDESETAPYDINPESVLNSPGLRLPEPLIRTSLFYAGAPFSSSICDIDKRSFPIVNLFPDKPPFPPFPLRC